MQIFKNFLILMAMLQVFATCSSGQEELPVGSDIIGSVQIPVRVNQDFDADLVNDTNESRKVPEKVDQDQDQDQDSDGDLVNDTNESLEVPVEVDQDQDSDGDLVNDTNESLKVPVIVYQGQDQDSDGDLVNDTNESIQVPKIVYQDSYGYPVNDTNERPQVTENVDLDQDSDIADIPEFKIRFMQNYSIALQYEKKDGGEEDDFLIDTRIGINNQNFQYRAGDIFLCDDSFRSADQMEEISGHSWGKKEFLEHKNRFPDDEFTLVNGVITIENSIRLHKKPGFKSIKNLKINFYYFDYETENYVLLKTETIERNFNAGEKEVFEVNIEEFSMAMITENYLKKGEFIISEISDFEIPELDTTYKELMASVQ